jgi:hypothetical protein
MSHFSLLNYFAIIKTILCLTAILRDFDTDIQIAGEVKLQVEAYKTPQGPQISLLFLEGRKLNFTVSNSSLLAYITLTGLGFIETPVHR